MAESDISLMTADPDSMIRVHAQWDGWRSADVRIADLDEVHWFRPDGAPHPLLHAYVSCARIAGGTILHACDRDSAPHRERVCILKRHAMPGLYSALAQLAP